MKYFNHSFGIANMYLLLTSDNVWLTVGHALAILILLRSEYLRKFNESK